MAIKLVGESMYHPLGGMNIDANGITARTNECIDAVNVDINADRVVQRPGTKSFPIPTNIGKVLKYHRYIHPTRGALLFAFCATGIYQYQELYGWVSVYAGAAFNVDTWSITDVVDREYGSTVVAAGSIYTRPTQGYNDSGSRILLIYDNQEGFTYLGLGTDLNPLQGGWIWNDYTPDANLDVEVQFTIVDDVAAGGGTILYTFSNSPQGQVSIRLKSRQDKEIEFLVGL